MAKRLYECIVCGRKFPEGQGITIVKGGVVLHFHSSRCAAKFLKALLENVDDSCITKGLKETVNEFQKLLENKKKASLKTI